MADREDPWTPLRLLTWTSDRFGRAGLGSPRLDAEVLLAHALGTERIRLYMDFDKPLAKPELDRFRELVRRRLAHEPVAYLTGLREFWSLPFRVDPRVLIPRPESELLVEVGRELLRTEGREGAVVVDVGTGSGALAVALARELPGARVLATDASPGALEVAAENVAFHEARVELLGGDLLAPLPQGLAIDLVVSNPPYIPTAELAGLAPEVRDREPRLALDGGADGLDVIRRLVPEAFARLASGGWLALEHGHDQGAAVSGLLQAAGLTAVAVRKDLAGLDRVTLGQRQ